MATDSQVGHPSTFQATSNDRFCTTDSGVRVLFLDKINYFPSSMDCIEEVCSDFNGVYVSHRSFRELEI